MKRRVGGRILRAEQRLERQIERRVREVENIYNIPNALTLLRVFITFITIYFIFAGYSIQIIIGLFIAGMLTDFFDGQIARRFNMKTEFGRKFDMIADRFLMIGTAFAFIVNLALLRFLTQDHILQIIILLSREFIAAPVALAGFIAGKAIPRAKPIGKATTVLQAVTFPMIILHIYYPLAFGISALFVVVTGIVGVLSGFTYILDILRSERRQR